MRFLTDQGGAVYILAVGIGTLFLAGMLLWGLNKGVTSMSTAIENDLVENSNSYRSKNTIVGIWNVIIIVCMIVVVGWIMLKAQRAGGYG